MKIKTVVVGPLETNCYILIIGNVALIIDPGDDWEKIEKECCDLNVLGVVVTHRHFDHIGALTDALNNTGATLYDIKNLSEGFYNIGNFSFKCIYTPGHKEDCISLYFEKENLLFCGDFIFYGSIGRWDFEGGSIKDMKESIKNILKFPVDMAIFPGHGGETNLGAEKDNLEKYLKCF